MTTTGEFLLSISSLASGETAIEHLQNVEQGEVIIGSEINLNVNEINLVIDIEQIELIAQVDSIEFASNIEYEEINMNIEDSNEIIYG